MVMTGCVHTCRKEVHFSSLLSNLCLQVYYKTSKMPLFLNEVFLYFFWGGGVEWGAEKKEERK